MDKGNKVWFNKILACGEWGSHFAHEGIFLGWGVDFEACKDGVGNFTVALVRLEDGTIEKVPTEQLKFETEEERLKREREELCSDIEKLSNIAFGRFKNTKESKEG